jgi:hypothetical protein
MEISCLIREKNILSLFFCTSCGRQACARCIKMCYACKTSNCNDCCDMKNWVSSSDFAKCLKCAAPKNYDKADAVAAASGSNSEQESIKELEDRLLKEKKL